MFTNCPPFISPPIPSPYPGLKKLLVQYPSLFVVDEDYVTVNLLTSTPAAGSNGTSGPGGTGPGRDYIQQSVDYFKHKLLQYGIGTEVPIKCLLGHRSQASPQIRHISGQHIKEFTDFLNKHPETFRVVDECVLLVGCDDLQDVPLAERLHLPQPAIDTRATQQLLDFFAACVQLKGPMLVEQLFNLVTVQFPSEQWLPMFKTPSDLSTFLKLFSDCFHVQSNLVTLLHKAKLSDAYIQQALTRTREQSTNNYTKSGVAARRTQSPHENNNSSSIVNNNNGGGAAMATTQVTMVGDFKLNEPVSNVGGGGGGGGTVNNRSEPNSGFDSLSGGREGNS